MSRPTRIRRAAAEHRCVARRPRPVAAGAATDPVERRAGGATDVASSRRLAVAHPTPCRWNRAPRSHSRSACQWISADRLVGDQRMAEEQPDQRRSVSGRRRSTRLVLRSGASVLALVDRDAQAVRLVADVDRVPAVHADERRDEELLVHRRAANGARRRRRSRAAGWSVYRCRSPNVLWTSTTTTRSVPSFVAAEEEAGRVEDVAEDPQVRDEGHAPAVRVSPVGAQMRPDVGRRGRAPGSGRWSASRKATTARPVAAEQPRAGDRPRRARRGRARRTRRRARGA